MAILSRFAQITNNIPKQHTDTTITNENNNEITNENCAERTTQGKKINIRL